MPFVELSLKSLEDLDGGRVPKAFTAALRRVVLDCIDRPGEKKPRSVTLQADVTPIVSTDGEMIETEGAHVEFRIKDKVPERKSKTYACRANKKGQLAFSSTNPEDCDQTTFDDIDPKTGRVNRENKKPD